MSNETERVAVLRGLARVRRWLDKLEGMTATRDELLRQGRALGITSGELAAAAGVSDSRVRQLAAAAAVAVESVAVESVPRLPVGAPMLSEHVSTTTRTPWSEVETAWVELGNVYDDTAPHQRRGLCGEYSLVFGGDTAAELLNGLPPTCTRVMLCGAAPQGPGANVADRVRGWGLEPLCEGWAIGDNGHFTEDTDAPVWRFTKTYAEGGGRTVEVRLASEWFGAAGAVESRAAWALLNKHVGAVFPGGKLLASPATTGRELWRRTIPAGVRIPVLSEPVRELIANTSGQGRMELVPGTGQLENFTYLDGRLMYAGLTWGLPVGEPTRRAPGPLHPDELDAVLKLRGRWLVRATVPQGWDKVGILGTKDTRGGWSYPRTPGTVVTTWADACEVQLAHRWGWECELVEGLVWDPADDATTGREGKPLNAWTAKLVAIYTELREGGQDVAARGVRAMILHAIGAFASRKHMVTRWLPLADEDKVPGNARAHVLADRIVWEEPAAQSEWTLNLAHPEWSAAIWARARVRLLDGPGADGGRVGALHLLPGELVAFRTDAIYTAHNPGWADDGRVSRFRVKGQLHEPRPWPRTNAELFALRDESEGVTL